MAPARTGAGPDRLGAPGLRRRPGREDRCRGHPVGARQPAAVGSAGSRGTRDLRPRDLLGARPGGLPELPAPGGRAVQGPDHLVPGVERGQHQDLLPRQARLPRRADPAGQGGPRRGRSRRAAGRGQHDGPLGRAGEALVRQVLRGPGRARVAGRRHGRAPVPAGRPGRGHARGLRAAHARMAGRARLDGPALGHRDQLRRPPRLRQGGGGRAPGARSRVGGPHLHRLPGPRRRPGVLVLVERPHPGDRPGGRPDRRDPARRSGLPDGAGLVRRRRTGRGAPAS